MDQLSFIRASGIEIGEYLTDLGQLRISVFRDFPYLYAGSPEYEQAYLNVYLQTPLSFLFAVYSGSQMIGATTGIPLIAETAEVQRPFLDAGYALDRIFYFGESVLLPAFRGRGLGHLFFDEREAFAAASGVFTTTCFCAVDRPADHPMRPLNDRPNDAFWQKRGYIKHPELFCRMAWKDLDHEEETEKTLTFWTKSLV